MLLAAPVCQPPRFPTPSPTPAPTPQPSQVLEQFPPLTASRRSTRYRSGLKPRSTHARDIVGSRMGLFIGTPDFTNPKPNPKP